MCTKQIGPTGTDDLSADSTSDGPIRVVTGWVLARDFVTIDQAITLTWRSGDNLTVKVFYQTAAADPQKADDWTVLTTTAVSTVGQAALRSNTLSVASTKMWIRFGMAGALASGTTAETGGATVTLVGSGA